MPYAGELLALLGAFFFSFSNINLKTGLVQGNRDIGMIVTLLVNNAINIIILAVFYLLSLVPPMNLSGLMYFALAGFLTSNLGRLFYMGSMNYIGVSRATSFKLASPIFSVIVGIFILGERSVTWPCQGWE